jgi:hypothetical protein
LGARGINVLMTITLDAHAHDVRLALVADHHTVLRPLQLTDTADHLPLFPTPDAARAPDQPFHLMDRATSSQLACSTRQPEGTP